MMTQKKIAIEKPWSKSVETVLETLEVDPEQGLDIDDAKQRREEYGDNRLREVAKRSVWDILLEQFKSIMIGILFFASLLAFFLGDAAEAFAIFVVILINATIGFGTEYRAIRSMEAFQELESVSATVRRNGDLKEVDAKTVVPGDIVRIESGDLVVADLRLIETSKMQMDESALTGESVPVSKSTDPDEPDTRAADRSCIAYKGTSVTRGSGLGVVVRTGMQTEIGTISSLTQKAEEAVTPLEKRLNQLSHNLVYVTLSIGVLVTLMGVLAGRELILMIETGIALAIATVPEGLPLVATLGLARGMWRMARRNAIVDRLSSVETLGTTSVICTDKTGTLTESRMTVTTIWDASGITNVTGTGMALKGEFHRDDKTIDPKRDEIIQELLKVGLFANEASTEPEQLKEDGQSIGEPLEIAILVAGVKAGFDPEELLDEFPRVKKIAFDPELKMMACFNRNDDELMVSVKGAPEEVLEVSSSILTRSGVKELDDTVRDEWRKRNKELASDGLRVIGFAQKSVDDEEINPYSDLTFLGLAGLLDPARAEVEDSIRSCKNAGIQVVMVTGDHPETAEKIAKEVGLVDTETRVVLGEELEDIDHLSDDERSNLLNANVMARVSPEQKLDLVELHQRENRVVAMTGDGVNDAPALKKADIGVAMGMRGTQVAQEAADIVLRDDRFSTIVYAIEEGRVIFNNIRRFVLYLLSCNMSEIIVIALFSLLPGPLPITPLQILFLNVVTDVFPALALGVGEGDPTVMNRPPRGSDEPIITKNHWLSIGSYGSIITTAVLVTAMVSSSILNLGVAVVGTMVFLTLAFSQLWHVFNMRSSESDILNNEVTTNPYVWVAIALCVPLLIVPVYLPGLSTLLSLVDPGLLGWGIIILLSLAPLIIGQVWKTISKRVPRFRTD
ncbi:MAG: ATPase [Candidatus Thorarchaeota archaeon]|nr:MAG: ATPase [Candidatus Thorarchaeota archaeon]